MKRKSVLLIMLAILVGVGAWGGRVAWRAHRQLVSLHVRNMPLAEVLRKIESQTWERIHVEKGMDARITLSVTDKPLNYVLDRIGEQAGAQWSTVHAVYGSQRSLKSLESALTGDGKLEPAGWTKIAPDIATLKIGGVDDSGNHLPAGPDMQVMPFPSSAGGAGGGRVVTATEDTFVPGPGQANGASAKGGKRVIAGGPIVVRSVRGPGAEGAGAMEEIWTPEELVLESALKGRIGTEKPGPTAADAADLAKKIKASWKTYLAFRKSPFVFSGPMLSHSTPGLNTVSDVTPIKFSRASTNGPITMPPSLPNPQEMANRDRNDRFARLTPEQRVLRARQQLNMSEAQKTNAL